MKQEDKELLLVDLYARLPYGFTIHRYSDNSDIVIKNDGISDFAHFLEYSEGEDFKSYLRPMSSMTEEEREELAHYDNSVQRTDFFYSHHIDCRYMIEKGLVLEAPEEMYNLKD